MNTHECKHGYSIKTQHQPDGLWEARVVGTEIVHYAETELKAVVNIVEIILPEDGEGNDTYT